MLDKQREKKLHLSQSWALGFTIKDQERRPTLHTASASEEHAFCSHWFAAQTAQSRQPRSVIGVQGAVSNCVIPQLFRVK
jgi:hypothetical protein